MVGLFYIPFINQNSNTCNIYLKMNAAERSLLMFYFYVGKHQMVFELKIEKLERYDKL